jgi:hypothetical protein
LFATGNYTDRPYKFTFIGRDKLILTNPSPLRGEGYCGREFYFFQGGYYG